MGRWFAARTSFAGWAVVWGLSAACGQTAAKLEFDVASVRQNKSSDKPTSNFSLDGGNIFSVARKDDIYAPTNGVFAATGQPLLAYINFAYKLSGTEYLALRFKEFIGPTGNVPAGMSGDKFDIQARADGNPSKDQMRAMMQALLAERFKLAVHKETREVPAFEMVLAKAGKTGPALHAHPAEDACSGDAPEGLPPVCGVIVRLAPSVAGKIRVAGRDVAPAVLAGALPTHTGMATLSRPVVDETGLTGRWDFAFEWSPDAPGTPDAAGPSFQDALRDQLGLKLVPQKEPVEVLVIDHVELPTAN